MKILDRLIGRFYCQSSKSAYDAAMKDIKEYKRSMISYRVVAPSKNYEVIIENYVGGSKKQHIEEFKNSHPEVYVSYIKAFTEDEAERYFQYLRILDAMLLRTKQHNGE